MTDAFRGDRLLAYSPLGDDQADEQLRLAKKRHEEYLLTHEIVGRVEVLFTALQPGQARLLVQNPPDHLTIETVNLAIRELEAAREFMQGAD
jgi:hypothetical protein